MESYCLQLYLVAVRVLVVTMYVMYGYVEADLTRDLGTSAVREPRIMRPPAVRSTVYHSLLHTCTSSFVLVLYTVRLISLGISDIP